MNILDLAKHFHVIPVNKNKSPKVKWNEYQNKKIDPKLLIGEYFGIICGIDGLMVIDVDNPFGDADDLFQFIYDNYDLTEFPIVKTQSGGYHIYFKCKESTDGNQKLALRINDKGKPSTIVETRESGGYVVAPGSPNYELISGDIFNVPVITTEERNNILSVCRSLDEIEKDEPVKQQYNNDYDNQKSPADTYHDDSHSLSETIQILKNHGWTTTDNIHWKRPNKDTQGISATLGKKGKDKFYVFTSNSHPFTSNDSHTKFGVKALLEYNGDFSACAKDLAKRYGIKTKKKEQPAPSSNNEKQKLTGKWAVLAEILRDWNLKFRYNVLTKCVEYQRKGSSWKVPDLIFGDLVYEMEVNKGIKSISSNKIREMINNTIICKEYNPITLFFKGLPKWDGVDYFKKVSEYITLDKDEIPEFFVSMLKKHLIRAVLCAQTDYVNRNALVFYSHEQEIGKTSFLRWLVPSEIYSEENIDPNDKDSILSLSRYLILNMDELDSLNRKELGKLKSFISKGGITKRLPYGRTDEKFERIATIFGSTNKMDILTDETNTRWLILKVKDFNWKGYTKDIDPKMLWAQAVAELAANSSAGELTKEEKQERERRNNLDHLETSQERELLQKYFREDDTGSMTATDIKIAIEKKHYNIKINDHQLYRELGRIFGKPKKTTVRGVSGRFYPVTYDFGEGAIGGKVNYYDKENVEEEAPF